MILAAGFGKRLRPLTDDRPKALVPVCGRPIIDYTLSHLKRIGIRNVVVNLHYRGSELRKYLEHKGDMKIIFSDERHELLDTGGGVVKAMDNFGGNPFLVINCDIIWLNGVKDTLLCMAEQWDDSRHDALLLVHPTVSAPGYRGLGDFFMSSCGGLTRRSENQVAPFIFCGVQILHPRLFTDCTKGRFSLNSFYDQAEKNLRLGGLRHDGTWLHLSQKEDLLVVESALSTL